MVRFHHGALSITTRVRRRLVIGAVGVEAVNWGRPQARTKWRPARCRANHCAFGRVRWRVDTGVNGTHCLVTNGRTRSDPGPFHDSARHVGAAPTVLAYKLRNVIWLGNTRRFPHCVPNLADDLLVGRRIWGNPGAPVFSRDHAQPGPARQPSGCPPRCIQNRVSIILEIGRDPEDDPR